MKQMKIGLVGCGKISDIYLANLAKFDFLETVACADLEPGRARDKAARHRVPRAVTPGELLADPEIDIVLNLTTPEAHAGVCLGALKAGKHVYTEKPLAPARAEAREVLEAARAAGLRVGCAPDTFLGGAHQACRNLLDSGAIGRPTAACAFLMCHGHESWHPDPDFYYRAGGGPMFDMGPYYLASLVCLLGPVRGVSALANAGLAERVVGTGPGRGRKIPVEVPTHVAGLLEFRSGAAGVLVTSFDAWKSRLPKIEIYGTEGVLELPDPNLFGGTARIFHPGAADWEEIAPANEFLTNHRGLGLAEMALAIAEGRPHRADGRLAAHVVDIMQAFHESAREGRRVETPGECPVPEPLPDGGLFLSPGHPPATAGFDPPRKSP